MRHLFGRAALLAGAGIVMPAFASAQTTRAEDTNASGQTIVVTGLRDNGPAHTGSKTETPLRDVPASIVVIPKDVLIQQSTRTLDAALTNSSAVAPNFTGAYGIGDNYVIRGLPMRFLRDGLPEGPTFNSYRRTLADVASIAVLKGPGSALYGRAEAGGSVNLVTLAPTGGTRAALAGAYCSFDTRQLTSDVTTPLGGGFGVRLIANYEHTDGIRGLGQRFYDVLPTLTFTGGGHRVTLDYDYRDQRQVVDNYGQPFNVNRQLAPADRSSRYYSPFNVADQKINRVTLADEYRASSFLTLRAALVYEDRDLFFARNAGGNPLSVTGVMTGRNGRTQTDDARFWTGQFEAVFTGNIGSLGSSTLVGAEWQKVDLDTVRRNYSKGEFVAINTEAAALTPVPERSTQVEAGIKAAGMDGMLTANLAVFETKRDRYFVALAPGADPVPVGRQSTRGVELDITATPATGFTLLANGAYLDARNRSGALASVPLIATNQSVFGKFISSTPRWSGSIWANWEPQALPGASIGAGATYRGQVFVDTLELLRLPDQVVAKAAVGYRFGPVQANVVVDNLFGEKWYSVPTFVGGLPGAPRSVKVTLRAAI